MYIDGKVERSLYRLLQNPGSEGISPSDFIAEAIDSARRNNTSRSVGVALDADNLRAMELVIDLAMTAALTSNDWFVIHRVAEMVGLEDADDDPSMVSIVG